MQAYKMYQQYAGAGAAPAAGGPSAVVGQGGVTSTVGGINTTGWAAAEAGAAGSAGAGGGAGAAGSAAGGGAQAGGSALAAAGPWALLAAAIVGNEVWANKNGRRPDDFGDHIGEILSGKVKERDLDALGDNIGGPIGDHVQDLARVSHPKGVWDVGVDGLRAIQDVFD